eukprot:13691627-Alexandrium_andersonii.AAC.1
MAPSIAPRRPAGVARATGEGGTSGSKGMSESRLGEPSSRFLVSCCASEAMEIMPVVGAEAGASTGAACVAASGPAGCVGSGAAGWLAAADAYGAGVGRTGAALPAVPGT